MIKFENENKLKSVIPNIISLKESNDRRDHLVKIMKLYNITDWRINVFKRFEYDDLQIYSDIEKNEQNKVLFGVTTSHLISIKRWYETTDEEYGLFFEDDVSFENVMFWNFSFHDFIKRLPHDWSAIQLCGIYEVNLGMRIRERTRIDHGLQAYVLTRSFAKKLLDKCMIDFNTFVIKHPGEGDLSIENILYSHKHGKVYSFPLFNHDINNFKSSYTAIEDLNGQAAAAVYSYDFIRNWWFSIGRKLYLDEIINL